MAQSYAELRRMTDDELIRKYDETAKQTMIGLDFLRNEVVRRESERATRQMLALTRQMRNLTLVITGLTVANVVAVALSLAR